MEETKGRRKKKKEEVAEIVQEEKTATAPISEEDFKEQIHNVAEHNRQQLIENFKKGYLYIRDYSGVRKFKSVRRAIRRGHVSIFGDVYPKRPFNNRKAPTNSITGRRRFIYEQFVRGTKSNS